MYIFLANGRSPVTTRHQTHRPGIPMGFVIHVPKCYRRKYRSQGDPLFVDMLREPNFMPYGYGHARFLFSRLSSNSSPRSGIYVNHA